MPENNINKAQAIFWMGMTGIGYIIGSFLGGFVVESIGLLDSFFHNWYRYNFNRHHCRYLEH